jgi:hypothetical protein
VGLDNGAGAVRERDVERPMDLWRVVCMNLGKRMAIPARIAGRQAQKIAAVVSIVDHWKMGSQSFLVQSVLRAY